VCSALLLLNVKKCVREKQLFPAFSHVWWAKGAGMAKPNTNSRWYFSEEKIGNSPSRKYGISAEKEESYRQQAANFIQDMGQRLQV
jgi:hypothetical protein